MDLIKKIKVLQNYFKIGNFQKVIEDCKNILKKLPDNPFVLNYLGMAYQKLNQHRNAIYYFEESLKKDNQNVAAMNNLGNSLKALGELENAKMVYEKIISKDNNYINAYNNYANLKILVNDYDGAIDLLEKASTIGKRNNINILFSLASAYQSINKISNAIDLINEILSKEPEYMQAHQMLSSIYRYSKDDQKTIEHLEVMKMLSKKKDLSLEQKIPLFFALSKAFDDLKDLVEAYKFMSQANDCKFKTIKSNLENETKLINNIIKTFEKIDLQKINKGFSDKKIIFICGMPRSGTTLVEQIISSHADVYGAGELIYLMREIKRNFIFNDKLDFQKIIESQNSQINLINQGYFKNFILYNLKQNIITDKAPQNFKWLGFVKIFFPNCKVVHCRRNPRDNCLSIYKNNFASNMMNWAYKQNEIAQFYNTYKKLMNFWKIKLNDFIYDVEYEKIVSNKEFEIKKLLEFCDLNWDESCLNHSKNSKTPIKTVSISQAREDVYTSSVKSSELYKHNLKEMFDALI